MESQIPNAPSKKQSDRKGLEGFIVLQVSYQIDEILLRHLAEHWTVDQCDQVRETVLESTRLSLVTLAELRYPLELKIHVDKAIVQTLLLLRGPEPSLMKTIIRELAKFSLLPGDLSTATADGKTPTAEEIGKELVFAALDCEFAVRQDPKSTWNERRLARACLVNGFISALALVQEPGGGAQ